MTMTELRTNDRGRFGPQAPSAPGPQHGAGPTAAALNRPVAGRSADYSHVLTVIGRIEGHLDEETAALSSGLTFDLGSSNNRKSQGLVDLNCAVRVLSKIERGEELQKRLSALREKLDRNLRVVRLHLNAVKEISDVLSDAIQSVESDGTYRPMLRPGRRDS